MQNQPKYTLQSAPLHFQGKRPLYMHDDARHPSREIVYLHRHDCMELGFCVEGEGVFAIEGKLLNFKAGDLSLIGPAEAHLAGSSPGTTSHWIWFYLDFEKLLLPHFPELDLSFLTRLHGPRFCNILDGSIHPWVRTLPDALFRAEREEEQTAWILLIALRLKDTFNGFQPEHEDAREVGEFERIAKAVSYFGHHYAGRVSIGAVARLCGMSMTNFRRIFKQETGVSPQDYLNRLRICMAKTELRAGKYRISEIASRCGFPSISGFNRQFRKQMRCSPRDFSR